MTEDLAKFVQADTNEYREVEVGQWYWVKEEGEPWLGCVTHIGSNYVSLEGLHRTSGDYHCKCSQRIHFGDLDKYLLRLEEDPDGVIKHKVDQRKENVERLLSEIKELTARLGITPAGSIPDVTGTNSTALVAVHNTEDVKAHKQALIKAKTETLPDLFKRVEEEHKVMAEWMKVPLIPMKAAASNLKDQTSSIEDRIFVVELYAGLCEEMERIREGEPGSVDEKVHLLQRRHYMDEECLVDYEAGGMEFGDIRDFDKWLLKDANRERILPFPKCVVAFQVRRSTKEREAVSLHDYIRIWDLQRLDKATFLYLRNGDQVYRLATDIDFGEELFPDLERSHLLGGSMYIDRHQRIATEREFLDHQEKQKKAKAEYRKRLAEWEAKPKEGRGLKPWLHFNNQEFEPLTPETVYYDDGMRQLADQQRDHNRVAVVLQGLLDRSPAFHPHPAWQLWTPDGFSSGIELVYDKSRAMSDGPPPDFEAYREKLNAQLKRGSHTVGQQDAWLRHEARKENDRQNRDWRIRRSIPYERFSPFGNPGPGKVAPIANLSRDKRTATFQWERDRRTPKWEPNPNKSGWEHQVWGKIAARFRCSTDLLFNVDAYTPGDYKKFYVDPRTRANYLKWAPLLLAAEDWHAGKDK